ncbi:MAG: hypothetical protein D6805_06990 [Planctomycetota bacterium]|nr:MAG: hypothetical protein D6805_06990 [Planctomycetota bacterium]
MAGESKILLYRFSRQTLSAGEEKKSFLKATTNKQNLFNYKWKTKGNQDYRKRFPLPLAFSQKMFYNSNVFHKIQKAQIQKKWARSYPQNITSHMELKNSSSPLVGRLPFPSAANRRFVPKRREHSTAYTRVIHGRDNDMSEKNLNQDPGEFTKKFDAEIFNKYLESSDQKLDEVEEKLAKVQEILEKRKNFLLQRFENCKAKEMNLGVELEFFPNHKLKKSGKLHFHCNLNEATFAMFLEYQAQIEGNLLHKDYISFSLKRLNLEKVERFVEAKILQFAREYVKSP